jgi:2'-5' RNA ligase
LGDVPVIKRDILEKALAKAAANHTPFTLTATGLGCFPNLSRPRVLWVGIQQDLPALLALRDAVEEYISPLGYPTEDRAFNPHLTLGRIQRDARRSDVQNVADLIAKTEYTRRHIWQVNDVQLIRSELKPSGAEYTTLFYAPLKNE